MWSSIDLSRSDRALGLLKRSKSAPLQISRRATLFFTITKTNEDMAKSTMAEFSRIQELDLSSASQEIIRFLSLNKTAMLTDLKASTDFTLSQMNTLMDRNHANSANIIPLMHDLTKSFTTAGDSLKALKGKVSARQLGPSNAEIATLLASIVTALITTLSRLLVRAAIFLPALPMLIAALDLALRDLLVAVEALVDGVLVLVAGLLVGVAGLLASLGLGLVGLLLGL
ncbi:hypothetical protein BDN71DRAFT_1594088 [Pleurotus eryngii]|uniref:Uncharacterized protein n=1 Tax=Pleurotus eryngii TaxID=5323 RepID=A0A9P6D9Z7_PLEER|nr:hypothetical protein BDN71DRAFT_1594088 [Pleurotus eryngii]